MIFRQLLLTKHHQEDYLILKELFLQNFPFLDQVLANLLLWESDTEFRILLGTRALNDGCF